MNNFLEKLHESYNLECHKNWLKNISKAVKKVNPYVEDVFFTNHFEHFKFLNNEIKKEDYFKFHQGMWHLHMMSFFLKNGFKLLKPTGEDDIEIDMGNFKIYIECTCPGWGRQNNYIGKTYIEIFKKMGKKIETTEITELHKNFIEKSVSSINNKVEKIKKRKENRIKDGKKNQNDFYLVAINEGLLINGFDKWNNKGLEDRASDVISRLDNPILDGIIYGSIGESSYFQIEDRLFGKIKNSDDRITKVFKNIINGM